MKKRIIFCFLLIFLVGCSEYYLEEKEDDNEEVQIYFYENEEETRQNFNTETEPIADLEEKIEIIAEYTLPDSIGWYTRHFFIVKNNSDYTVELSTSSLAYDEGSNLISVGNGSVDALGSGCVSVFYEAFETSQEISFYETELSVDKSKNYESVIEDLSYVVNEIEDGIIVQVTNNGMDAAEFVEVYALFFLNNELVSYENVYAVDDEYEIKPGDTVSEQMMCYTDFDYFEIYLSGRKYFFWNITHNQSASALFLFYRHLLR